MTLCPGSSSPGRRQWARRRQGAFPELPEGGFTLVELLAVLFIIALIGSLGAGAYQVSKRNYSLVATAGHIQGVIRAARNTALRTGIPTTVVVDPVHQRVSAHAFERVGEWSFEGLEEEGVDPLWRGSFTNHGAAVVPGKVGMGLSFDSGGAYVDCGAEARFDLRTTIHIQCWVRHFLERPVKEPRRDREEERGRRLRRGPILAQEEPAAVLVEKAGAYFFGMAPDGALAGGVGEYRVRTRPGVVAPARWVRVAMRYDGRSIELSADGVPRETQPTSPGASLLRGAETLPAAAPVTDSPLTVSSESMSFPGSIDEVTIAGGVEPLVHELEDQESILGWRKIVHFDGRGHLDSRFHSRGVRIVLVELDSDGTADGGPGSGKTQVGDFSLTFQEWLAAQDGLPELRQEVEEARIEARHAGERKVVLEIDRLGVVK